VPPATGLARVQQIFMQRITNVRTWAMITVIVIFAGTRSARAETISGTVLDPQAHPIVGVKVSLTCEGLTDARTTDGQGHFTFVRQLLPENCKIRASYPGFATLEFTLGQKRTLTLELRLAEVKQTVLAKGDALSLRSVSSASLSASELRTISDDSDDLLAYAKQLAGVYSGSDHIYVDGLPADHPPPADRIESITINADPFSAEYSDGSDTHIDIITKTVDRTFHLSSSGISFGPDVHDGLNPHLTSSSNTATLGLSGPVPDLPLVFTSDLHFVSRQREVPIEAVVPPVQEYPISSVAAATATDFNLLFGLGAEYSKGETFRVNTSLYVARARHSNVDVSGLTLPEAGSNASTAARQLRTTIRKTGQHYIYRGGMVLDWLNKDLRANSSSLGISVSGDFIAGGAQTNRSDTRETRWTLKNVFDFDTGEHYWSVGATISRRVDQQSITPNPVGYIQFDNLEDYILSATTGTHTGIGLVTRGQGNARYALYRAAPFVQGEVFRRTKVSVRAGLRADYQTAAGLVFSPRLSAVTTLHGFVFRVGTGMFVHDWTNDIFLRVMENDGQHLQQFLIANASLSDIQEQTATLEPEIISKLAPNLKSTQDWVSKLSAEHSFGNFAPGFEYTWTDGTHLLGSERLGAPTGWTDVLESNRALSKQQFHFRTRYKIRGQSLTAHYEWIRSFDNTDGPFSFPEISGDLRDEWARSTGVSPHNFTIVGNFQMPGGVSVNVVGSWRSSAPYNVTTGLDPEHYGLYNDRGRLPRNSGKGPNHRNVTLYAFRRFRILGPAKESKHSLYVNAGFHAENLFGSRNYLVLDSVSGSPIFGQPLSAFSGRSFRLSLNLNQ
jgi:hypothetical protein